MHPTSEEMLEIINERVPFNRLLGIRGESVQPGRATLVMDVKPEHVGDTRRPALHGGVVSALIDTAGGAAAWSALGVSEAVSTVDMTVDFLEPVTLAGPLRAEAELVRKGNKVCHVRVRVTQDGLLVAEGRAVYNVHQRSVP